jgi:hypothetical protein
VLDLGGKAGGLRVRQAGAGPEAQPAKPIALLREQGLVVTVKGRGSYVNPSR